MIIYCQKMEELFSVDHVITNGSLKKKMKLKFFNYLIVLIISFIALIILLDTFKNNLSEIFPNLELFLYNLFETIKDLQLFFNDIFK